MDGLPYGKHSSIPKLTGCFHRFFEICWAQCEAESIQEAFIVDGVIGWKFHQLYLILDDVICWKVHQLGIIVCGCF